MTMTKVMVVARRVGRWFDFLRCRASFKVEYWLL